MIELEPLCTATFTFSQQFVVSSTLGIAEFASARFDGERLSGSMKGVAADWLRLTPDGYGIQDVKLTIETDDLAIIHIAYTGRFLLDSGTAYVAPSFHTGDERYAWLNRAFVIAKGAMTDATTLTYEMFEVG